jgi:hypothetical protein
MIYIIGMLCSGTEGAEPPNTGTKTHCRLPYHLAMPLIPKLYTYI